MRNSIPGDCSTTSALTFEIRGVSIYFGTRGDSIYVIDLVSDMVKKGGPRLLGATEGGGEEGFFPSNGPLRHWKTATCVLC